MSELKDVRKAWDKYEEIRPCGCRHCHHSLWEVIEVGTMLGLLVCIIALLQKPISPTYQQVYLAEQRAVRLEEWKPTVEDRFNRIAAPTEKPERRKWVTPRWGMR